MSGALSTDAMVVFSSTFAFGEKTTLRVGGKGARSILSDRGRAALEELVAAGMVEARPFNEYGRMEYQGTEKMRGVKRLSLAKMEEHGRWSLTVPNPAWGGEAS